ncbi:MAG: DUF1049 domain-containing protein [Clostridiales bacterium]|nr:DUF1049 domain-containing protein [Clostridiales bacterium]
MQIYFIFSLIASIILIVFAITNATPVPIKIFMLQYELSLALIIFICTAFGAIIATFIGFVKQFKLKKEIKNLKKENKELMNVQEKLNEEISSLKISLENYENLSEEIMDHEKNILKDNELQELI